MKRRVLLAVIIPLLLISCGDDEKQTIIDDHSTITKPSPVILFDETVKVDAGGYRKYFIYSAGELLYRIEVKSDLDVNVWLIAEEELSHFEKNESFKSIPSASRERITSFNADFFLPSGDYYLILDNRFSWITPKNVSIKLIVG